MKERVYKMLDGYELIVSEEALFVRVAEGRMAITTSEEVEFDRVLALVGHLQQQLTEKDEIIETLRTSKDYEIELHAQTCIEKDATIKELQDKVKKWRAQAEAKILFVSNGNNERMYELQEDNLALRKALEDARDSIQVIDAHGERPWEVTSYCERAIELIDAALGEGDKHGN